VLSQHSADIADTLHMRDVGTATTFRLSIYVVHIREPSMCGSNAELCQITLNACHLCLLITLNADLVCMCP